MSNYEDTGDWPFRESAPVRAPLEPERQPEPQPVAPVLVEPEPEPEQRAVPEAEPESESSPEPEPIAAEPEPIAAEVAPQAEAWPEPEVEDWPEPEAEAMPEPPEDVPAEQPVVAPEEELVAGAALPSVEELDDEPEEEPPVAEHAVGELDIPGGYTLLEGAPTGERRTVGIVVSRFNGEVTNRLLESAFSALDEAGVARDAVTIMPVPGAFELPLAAMALAKTRRFACVVALGCVIRGETPHFDFVAGEAASGLQLAAVETGVPVSFGLLTCETQEQAEARVGKGAEAVQAALEMADLFAQLRAQAASGG